MGRAKADKERDRNSFPGKKERQKKQIEVKYSYRKSRSSKPKVTCATMKM